MSTLTKKLVFVLYLRISVSLSIKGQEVFSIDKQITANIITNILTKFFRKFLHSNIQKHGIHQSSSSAHISQTFWQVIFLSGICSSVHLNMVTKPFDNMLRCRETRSQKKLYRNFLHLPMKSKLCKIITAQIAYIHISFRHYMYFNLETLHGTCRASVRVCVYYKTCITLKVLDVIIFKKL